MKVEKVNVDDLKPHPKNPRVHPKSAIEKLGRSIKEFGWTNPVLVSADGYILAGHARVKAAKKAGIKDVPVIRLALDGAKAEAYMIADNRLQEETGWDEAILKNLVAEINDQVDLSIAGFSDKEISSLLGEAAEESAYTKKVQTPHYQVTGDQPALADLVNSRKTEYLVECIQNTDIAEDEKEFLVMAAQRFLVFNYGRIAEYYVHASKGVQEIMEKLALVIIDYDNAIENGFVELSKTVEEIMGRDYEG